MKCEIEFLAVGDASRAGDAIIVRYGELNAYRLMLVDGGHSDTGERIVAHLRQHYGPYPVLDHVVLTHSDADHASGLRSVLRQVRVGELWLHAPWYLAGDALPLFADKRLNSETVGRRIVAEYDIIREIVELAHGANVAVRCPFAGSDIGPFRVLSPSRGAYLHLLPQFDRTPEADQAAIAAAGMWIGKESLGSKIASAVRAAAQGWVRETWDGERLRDGGITSASNESSVVLYGLFERGPVLLTGDAGIWGLTWAARAAQATGLPLGNFAFVQIPHHGSRRNVGPTILTELLGSPQPEGAAQRFSAYVSAPADDEQHPRRIVLNAFRRRGGTVIATQGQDKVHWGGFDPRPGYTSVEGMPFSTVVEAYT